MERKGEDLKDAPYLEFGSCWEELMETRENAEDILLGWFSYSLSTHQSKHPFVLHID